MGLPLLRTRDMAGAIGLAALLAPARLLPTSRWDAVCRAAARLLVAARPAGPGTAADLAAHVRRVVGPRRLPVTPGAVRAGMAATHLDSLLLLLRRRDDATGIELAGREHLDDALREGRGAMLLIHNFHESLHLLALEAHGYPAARVTSETHGFFVRSVLAERWLAPLQRRLEDREGIERITARAGSFAHLRRIVKALGSNRLVIQRLLSPGMAREDLPATDAPFLEGRLPVFASPLRIAAEAGAPVLPAYPLRAGDGRYRLVVGAPLADGDALLPAMAADLEPVVLRHPAQWTTWHRVLTTVS